MKDIKYLGVPNVCFSLTHKNDKREIEFKKQRIKQGFDESETWSLRDTISNFIIPRLELYQEIAGEKLLRSKELVEDIDNVLVAFKLIARDNGCAIFDKDEQAEVDKGLDAFPKVFMSLWW